MSTQSLQERYSPEGICFGCGPANPHGLHVRSFVVGDELLADWRAGLYQEALPVILNGGIVGTLLDCHCNWAAAYALMRQRGADNPPCTVTAEYTITLRRPTPTDVPVRLSAKVVELSEDRALVEGALLSNGRLCAACRGTFVAVQPGHPAYHRW
ncbi:MAG: PaaI family thioesterase [Vicinamibacteraceae bacterium]